MLKHRCSFHGAKTYSILDCKHTKEHTRREKGVRKGLSPRLSRNIPEICLKIPRNKFHQMFWTQTNITPSPPVCCFKTASYNNHAWKSRISYGTIPTEGA